MIASVPGLLTHMQLTGTDSARDAALSMILSEAEDEVVRFCHPNMLSPGTMAADILDAPWNDHIVHTHLRPVRSLTAVYFNPQANGVSASFTADHELTAGTHYRLVVDYYPEGWAKRGAIQILTRSNWGSRRVRRLDCLGYEPDVIPGAIKAVYTYGYTPPPHAVLRAIYTAATIMFHRRKTGVPVTSENWNGYGVGYAGEFTAAAAVRSPEVLSALKGFYDPVKVG